MHSCKRPRPGARLPGGSLGLLLRLAVACAAIGSTAVTDVDAASTTGQEHAAYHATLVCAQGCKCGGAVAELYHSSANASGVQVRLRWTGVDLGVGSAAVGSEIRSSAGKVLAAGAALDGRDAMVRRRAARSARTVYCGGVQRPLRAFTCLDVVACVSNSCNNVTVCVLCVRVVFFGSVSAFLERGRGRGGQVHVWVWV